MKSIVAILVVALTLGGCAAFSANPTEPEDDIKRPPGGPGRASAEELRIYIDEVKPEKVGSLRYEEPLRWTPLNSYFAIMEARTGPHLIEMAWECKELWSTAIYDDMADRRSKRGILRAKIDTLRGCRIENFYKLPDVEAQDASEDADEGDVQ